MAERVLWDLCGADPSVRFSPYCWRAKLALAHKGLAVETRPWRFTEKEALAVLGHQKVPVLVDGARVVGDSFAIARHLEEAYPDAPSLFGGAGGLALTQFVVAWADTALNPALIRLCVADIWACLDERDKPYFRDTRETRFGMALEAVQADRATRVADVGRVLAPLRTMLGAQPFLGGAAPLYADHAVFGSFQWVRTVTDFAVLAPDDPVFAWHERMLDAYDGLARRAPRAVAAA